MKTLSATAVNKHSDQNRRGLKISTAKLVYLSGDATAIDALGKFFSQCAKEMKGARPFHRHFRDFLRDWDSTMVDFVVARSASKAKRKNRPNKSPQRNAGIGPATLDSAIPHRPAPSSEKTARPQSPRG